MSRVKREELYVNLNLNVRGLEPSVTLAINEKCNKLKQEGRPVYKFGLGQSPFPVPQHVVDSLKLHASEKDYLPVKGLMELRKSVAEFNYRHQKIRCTAEDILIGPGSKELIFLLQLVYYGDLIIPTPSWVSYSPQARIIGRNVQWVHTTGENNWRLSPEKLDLICRTDPNRPRIVVLNYPSNPTGCTYPLERLKLLAQVARKYRVILISDEIYGLTHHTGQHVSIARFYPEGTIISSGISKWCGAGGWRLGTFTFPSHLGWLLNAMASVASETFTSTCAPIQYAAVEAFKDNPEMDEYLHITRKILRILAKYLMGRLEKMNVSAPFPQGAFYIFPDFSYYRQKLSEKGILTSVELCNKLLTDTGVAILPGADFGRPPEELTARLAYVDFDGSEAIRGAKSAGIENNLGEEYILKYCPRLAEGFDKLEKWLNDL